MFGNCLADWPELAEQTRQAIHSPGERYTIHARVINSCVAVTYL